jgi:LacI family transcriptional regulator
MAATIGALLRSARSIFHFEVLQGALTQAAKHGAAIKVFETLIAEPSLETLRTLSGIIVIADSVSDGLLRLLHASAMPTLLVAHRLPDLPISRCVVDNIQGMEALARHVLVECGRRAPIFLRGLLTQHDGRQRELAFRQVLANIGLSLPESRFLRGDFRPQVATVSLRAFLASGDPFDAIISADYAMALAALEVLGEAGVRVPQQVMLGCFGDSPEVQAAGITAVAVPVSNLGKCAVDHLLCLIEGTPIPLEITLPAELHRRRSTCSQSSSSSAFSSSP